MLGSIDVAKYLMLQGGKIEIDYQRLAGDIRTAVRFLDDAIDASKFPLHDIELMHKGNRKIGLGIMGWADLLIRLVIPYNSRNAFILADRFMNFLRGTARSCSVDLARQQGVCPNFPGSMYDAPGMPKVRNATTTTGHGDHTAGADQLKRLTGAPILIHALDAAAVPAADIRLDAEGELKVGTITFKVFHTPGHTPGGISLYADGHLFTGDTLFVGDSGRTDLPGGHRPTLAASIRRLMQLPDSTIVWPGHDYGPTPSSTIAWEKRHNVNAKEYGYYVQDSV